MPNDAATSSSPERTQVAYRYVRRGSALSSYLVFLLASSIFGVCVQLTMWSRLAARMSSDELLAFGVIMFLRPACLVAIWFWSRTGVIAYIMVTAVYGTLLSAYGYTNAIFSIIAPVMLIVLVREKWKFMRWGFSRRSRRVYDDDEEG